jgi:hypothetical protein
MGICWTLSRPRTIMCGNPDAERFDTKDLKEAKALLEESEAA